MFFPKLMCRKSKACIIAFMISILTTFATPIFARDALFLGITDASGRPTQAELARAVRNSLLETDGRLRLIDELETERIIRERERLGHGKMENTVPSNFELPDSTILIRGIVEEFSMKIKRHRLIWGKIEARMTVKFSFGDLTGMDAYHGNFSASAKRVKDLLLFRSAPKVVHISAIDRSEMSGEMRSDILKDVAEFVDNYLNSLAERDKEAAASERSDDAQDTSPVDTQDTASISSESDDTQNERDGTTPAQTDPDNADFSDAIGDDTN